jgi:beta propeller repeat protein
MNYLRVSLYGIGLLFITIQAQAESFSSFAVSPNSYSQHNPVVSGNRVAWYEYRDGDYSLWVKDLAGGEATCLTPNSTARIKSPSIDGNTVVWGALQPDGNWDIYGYDLASQTEFSICTKFSQKLYPYPSVCGSYVVWQDYRNSPMNVPPEFMNADIYGMDLRTGEEFQICTERYVQSHPKISGDLVVWGDERDWILNDMNVYGYDLSTGIEFKITQDPEPQVAPDVSGNYVVWVDNREGSYFDIYGMDLSTGEEFPICLNSFGQGQPSIDGNLVVWQDYRNPFPSGAGQGDIYGYDLITHTEFLIAGGVADQSAPQISGNWVVWTEMPLGGNPQIYGAYIPEPSSMALLLAGTITLLRKRKR